MFAEPIIDTHVHIYDPGRLSYSWMQNVPILNRPHLTADFRQDSGEVSLAGFLFVEVGVDAPHRRAEAHWIDSLGRNEPLLVGMVPSLALEHGRKIEADLEALAAMPRVRAVRRLIETEAEPGFCLQPAFLEGVRMLARHDLAFEICVRHWQLADAVDLVRRCPEVRFVLDHLGKPPIRSGEMGPWRQNLAALASLPNAVGKLSGVVTEADHETWTPTQLRPWLDCAVECFGFERLMFGSDWPVSKQTHAYRDWFDIVADLAAKETPQTRRRLFRDNAAAFYRLGSRAAGKDG